MTTTVRPRATFGQNRRRLWVATAVILAAVGLLVFKGLGNATVYFKTADEAVRDRSSLGDRRFRLEGTVLAGSVRHVGEAVDFTVGSKGATVDVVYQGAQPELFQPGIPVVLEGRWAGEHYASDKIMVKHTEQYRASNPARVVDYPPSK
jgi:cytochrome c-type biogenesis protein CcmE